jgi:Mn2+/Fe2+ NRAMP family transporter
MSNEKTTSSAASDRRWYQRLGPGLITACVVIGPGSILTSSNVGARFGYGRSWVVVVAVAFMLVYMSMGARLGVSVRQSAGTLIAERVGRWFAVLIGISVFFISAAFQFGNNLGVHYALTTYLDVDYLIVIFNALAIAFLLSFKNMYKALEKLMMLFVGLMLVAFACNLIISGPRFGEWFTGFIPGRGTIFDLSVLGLVGTTFVTSAAFYQSYLVRQKGWSVDRLRDGMIDVRVGAFIMLAITLMLMATPATVFHPDFRIEQVATESTDPKLITLIINDTNATDYERVRKNAQAEVDWKTGKPKWAVVMSSSEFEEKYPDVDSRPKTDPRGFKDLPEVGTSLKPLFGSIGPTLFFLGVFAAAYSSFLVNSMIGGFMLADGLGIGHKPEDKWPKIFTVAVLLIGMFVGLYCIVVLELETSPVMLIVSAQAATVLASPIVAGSLLWLTSQKDIMGENVNTRLQLTLGIIGLALLLAMSANLAITKVIPAIQKFLAA